MDIILDYLKQRELSSRERERERESQNLDQGCPQALQRGWVSGWETTYHLPCTEYLFWQPEYTCRHSAPKTSLRAMDAPRGTSRTDSRDHADSRRSPFRNFSSVSRELLKPPSFVALVLERRERRSDDSSSPR